MRVNKLKTYIEFVNKVHDESLVAGEDAAKVLSKGADRKELKDPDLEAVGLKCEDSKGRHREPYLVPLDTVAQD